MKKRLLSMALAVVLVCGLSVPAAAAETADQRLAAVTVRVKQTLGLDTEKYTGFYGDLTEDLLAPSWYLEWSGESGNLSVNTTEEGKVLQYHLYEKTGEEIRTSGFAPAFPEGSPEAAEAAAKAFLRRVLGSNESAEPELQNVSLGATTYRFSGEILLNGLPAGLNFSMAVRCADNVVTSFYRDDINGQIIGAVPSARAGIPSAAARAELKKTLSLRLEYVSGEAGQAVLRYLPEYGDDYYVEATGGQLVNLTELRREVANGILGSNGAMKEETKAEASSAVAGLSKAEQEGAERLKDAMSKDALDEKARSVTALGLENYTLSGADYTVAREEEETDHPVTAVLRYGRQVNSTSWRRTVTLDAKTGELLSVSSSGWLNSDGTERKVSFAEAETRAADFLRRQVEQQFGQTALYDGVDAMENDRRVSHSFTFVQKANGYFFPESYISVGVDATDGSISSYSNGFMENVAFDDPAGILTAEQALEAWLDTYTVQLGYVRVPTQVDYSRPEYKALQDYGISYLYRLVLGYTLEREDYLLGIDAKTGAAVEPDWTVEEDDLAYTDISNHWAEKEIRKLAQFDIGYSGSAFCPDSVLTQLDLVALLASAAGYRYDGSAADDLYEYAFAMGLLAREERNDAALLTRAESVRILVEALGYGEVARLTGIFRTGFADDAGIPAAAYGHVALAKGMGLVMADRTNCFRPNDAATRAQAAVMLCRFMER